MKRKMVLACVCVCLGAGSVQATDSVWTNYSGGTWFTASNWDKGVPNVGNGYVAAFKTWDPGWQAYTVSINGDLTGVDAIGLYFHDSLSQCTVNNMDINDRPNERYIQINGDVSLASSYGGNQSKFNLYCGHNTEDWSEMFCTNNLNMEIPSWGSHGSIQFGALGHGTHAYFMGNINMWATKSLEGRGGNADHRLYIYQSAEIYSLDGIWIDHETATKTGGTTITNRGVITFGGWDSGTYGTLTLGVAKDSAATWHTNLNAHCTFENGAYLVVDKTYYEHAADFTDTLIHMPGTNTWSGADAGFEEITLAGETVDFGDWVMVTNFTSTGSSTYTWYYQLDSTAVDGDAITNDVVLNVTTNEPPPIIHPDPEPYWITIMAGPTSVTVTADGIPDYGTNYLQSCNSLIVAAWTNIGEVAGVTNNSWIVTPLTDDEEFYRVESIYN